MYITIGTGVGAGVVVGGKIISGFAHPEAGHISLKRHPEDHYEGKCPFHRLLEAWLLGQRLKHVGVRRD